MINSLMFLQANGNEFFTIFFFIDKIQTIYSLSFYFLEKTIKMDKDNCYEDDFKSLITRCRTYLKKADFENGNLNKISRKKSCRNNIERSSTEFQDKW